MFLVKLSDPPGQDLQKNITVWELKGFEIRESYFAFENLSVISSPACNQEKVGRPHCFLSDFSSTFFFPFYFLLNFFAMGPKQAPYVLD